MRKMNIFLQNSAFSAFSALSAEHSLVENDRSPSFQGAPDGWESPRFLECF
jgi:hypothetical protein